MSRSGFKGELRASFAPHAEALLIAHFRPLWNVLVEGFGNHEPGAGRYAQPRSPWDELHPGHSWAARLGPSRRTRTEILQAVTDHLSDSKSPDLSYVPREDMRTRRNRP